MHAVWPVLLARIIGQPRRNGSPALGIRCRKGQWNEPTALPKRAPFRRRGRRRPGLTRHGAGAALVSGPGGARPHRRRGPGSRRPAGHGLTAADFEIREGGRPHEIASSDPVAGRPAPPPAGTGPPAPPGVSESIVPTPAESRYFLIFFDDVHVSAPAAVRVRAQLAPFLERETQEGDWVTIVSPLAGLKWTARTAFERRQLPAIIRGLKGQLVRRLHKDDPTDYGAMRMEEYGSPASGPPRGTGA